ncbi:MAG: phosphatidate cytidylyltransferase [Chloroflexi bacterium]|nr:phosphatidate cytidylyltransferase [Chloroflexota bacterium]
MIVKRIVTGLAIAVIVAIFVCIGGIPFAAAVCIIATLASLEFYRIVKSRGVQPLSWLGIVFSILLIVNAYIQQYDFPFLSYPRDFTLPFIMVLMTLIPLIWLLFRTNKDNAFINWGWTVAGILYIGWLISFYVQIRLMENGIGWIFLVLSCTALCDVGAYVVGSNLGKHAMASSVSPGKTWEGSAGGLAISIIIAVILSIAFKLPLYYWQMIAAGLIIGIFAQLGDLVESLLKRNMHAKDAGSLLPGHGGILDRIDSHLLVAPVAYYLIVLVNNQGWPPV